MLQQHLREALSMHLVHLVDVPYHLEDVAVVADLEGSGASLRADDFVVSVAADAAVCSSVP